MKNRPSVEEIRCWGDSFDRLMKSSMGRVVFREFLKCEYSEENILFWLACEDLKKDNNPEVVEEKARLIYEDYISILSPKEVYIPCELLYCWLLSIIIIIIIIIIDKLLSRLILAI